MHIGRMLLGVFCVLVPVLNIVSLPIEIRQVFHHVMEKSSSDAAGILIFYLSGVSKVRLISSRVLSPTVCERTYKIERGQIAESVIKRFPLSSSMGYECFLSVEKSAVNFTFRYDSEKLLLAVSQGMSIGNQHALLFHFFKRQKKNKVYKHDTQSRLVVIDCGHGGTDTGAIGSLGTREKDTVLSIGLILAKELKKLGYRVYLTRTDDKEILLDTRTSLSNTMTADLFISLHANYASNCKASGIETWYSSLQYKPLQQLSDKTGSVRLAAYIQERITQSEVPAHIIHKALIRNIKHKYPAIVDRDVRRALSQVLSGVSAPAVLVELGFLSNGQEEKLLASYEYQIELAQALKQGISEYLQQLSSNDK